MNKSEIISNLATIVKPFLNESHEISEDNNFVNDLGFDSIDMVDIVISIEDTFSIKFADKELDSFKTVGELINIIIIKRDCEKTRNIT